MSQITMVLADTDPVFIEKFSAYLQKNKATRFSVSAFTDYKKFDDWVLNYGMADVVAISSAFYLKIKKKPPQNMTIILNEGHESLLPADCVLINKFIPAQSLVKEILSFCSNSFPQRSYKSEKHGRINLILYADGSDVLNPIAQSISCIMARNKTTLYINLDEFSNTELYFSSLNNKGLSELLYYVKSKKENLPLKVEACTSKDFNTGVNFLKPHQNPEDMAMLKANELEQLLLAIQERALYDEIITSRSFRCDENLDLLLHEASVIYLSAMEWPGSLNRLSKICSYLAQKEGADASDLKNKVIICLTLAYKGQTPRSQGFEYNKVYLPFPFINDFINPSNEYLSALESIIK